MKLLRVQDDRVPDSLRELRRLVEQGETRIALDCSAWSYFGSADLGALLALRKELLPVDGEIVIVAPSPRLTRFIEMLGLREAFRIFDDLPAAQAHLQGDA